MIRGSGFRGLGVKYMYVYSCSYCSSSEADG